MNYIYFEMENLALFVAWLQKRPEGRYTVLIGRKSPLIKMASVLNFVQRRDSALGEWLKQKRVKEEIILAMSNKMDVPQGVVNPGWPGMKDEG